MISDKELQLLLQQEKRNTNHFFLPPEIEKNEINTIAATQALSYVINADYKQLEAILQITPSLMFAKATVKIDDETIESTPLQYAIDKADSYSWKICQTICQENQETHPEYETFFYKHKIENPVNLQPLFDAYDKYLTKFYEHKEKYKKEKSSDPLLQETWLNVGKMQQAYLPRHLLREMCQLSGRSKEYDLVLLSMAPEDAMDLTKLKKISEQHQKYPILIKQNNKLSLYGHSGNSYRWKITPLYSAQSIQFPQEFFKPQRLPATSVTNNLWEAIRNREWLSLDVDKNHCEPWNKKSLFDADNSPYSSAMVIAKTNKYPQEIESFFFDDPGWGTEFVLSRGAASLCIAVYTPFGHNGYLGYRMKEDMEILKRILEIRIVERDKQFEYAKPESHLDNSLSLS